LRGRTIKAKGLLFGLLLGAAPAAAQSPAPPGAAGCSGCHPRAAVEATAVQPLAGRPAEEIVAAMQTFRTGERSATVMGRIARGFFDEETRAIAGWVGAQR
jgi:cytochrome subunit of sulfide dehydrogenase